MLIKYGKELLEFDLRQLEKTHHELISTSFSALLELISWIPETIYEEQASKLVEKGLRCILYERNTVSKEALKFICLLMKKLGNKFEGKQEIVIEAVLAKLALLQDLNDAKFIASNSKDLYVSGEYLSKVD